MRGAADLLERTQEVDAIAAALDDVREWGAMILVEGPAGIGKTRVLAAADELAAERRLRVLRARAAELERGFPLGVVRQLFEPPVRAASVD